MKLVDNRTAAEIDRRAQDEYGIPGDILMENAGIRLFDALVEELRLTAESRIVFLAGSGNNGGDALVMARQALVHGFRQISVITVRDELKGLAARWLEVVRRLEVPVHSFSADPAAAAQLAAGADILVDGLTGTGLSGPLHGTAAECVRALGELAGPRVAAVDAPSGVGDDFRAEYPVLPAELTLSVAPAKQALYRPAARKYCGRIRAVPIGFPPRTVDHAPGWILMDANESRRMIPPFAADTYKNRRGHVAVFAGSRGALGAALMASEAAGRAGAGLVSLYVDADLYEAAASQMREVMVRPRTGDEDFSRHQACIVGPGWGVPGREDVFSALLKQFDRGVVDADGLSLLAASGKALTPEWILTPHPGECARLLNVDTAHVVDDPFSAARRAAERYGATVLLKGHVSCVAAPDGRTAVIDGMNPLLGTGGSGDILSGYIGGFLADTALDPFCAAAAGAYLHQQAGQKCARDQGVFLAGDLLPLLSAMTAGVRNAGA